MSNSSLWISVRDRLPIDGQNVLFCQPDGDGPSAWYKYPTTVALGTFSPVHGFKEAQQGGVWSGVSHWMPLPPSPASVSLTVPTVTNGDAARDEWMALFNMTVPKDDRTFRRMLIMAFLMGQVSTDETPK